MFAVVDVVVKRFFSGNQCTQALSFLELSVSAMQSAVLLRTAMNKLEGYGQDASSRIRQDKGSTLLSTIRSTRARFTETCDKIKIAKEELMKTLGEPSDDTLVLGLRQLADFDVPSSFDHSDLLKNVMYSDVLAHKLLSLKGEMHDAANVVKPLLRGMQNGGIKDWKHGLVEGCTMEVLQDQAKASLNTLNGSELRSSVKKLQEVRVRVLREELYRILVLTTSTISKTRPRQ